MPVEIEQQRGDICEFQRCSQLSVVKLYLNMVNLRKNMFLVLSIKKRGSLVSRNRPGENFFIIYLPA